MRPGETVRAALRGLRRRPLRNGLALVGVILATATLVALLALSTAARAQVLGGLEEQPMITTIQVTPVTQRAGVAPRPLDAAAVEAISGVAGVREVMPIVVVPATLRLGGRSPSGTVTGTILPAQVLPLAGQGFPAGQDGFDALLEALQSDAIYGNVHTDRFPSGEIRGQFGDRDND